MYEYWYMESNTEIREEPISPRLIPICLCVLDILLYNKKNALIIWM